MTMPRSPTWLRSRRALARISMTVRLGLSSIQMGAAASRPLARLRGGHAAPLGRAGRRRRAGGLLTGEPVVSAGPRGGARGRVDAGLAAQQPLRQLEAAHLEA